MPRQLFAVRNESCVFATCPDRVVALREFTTLNCGFTRIAAHHHVWQGHLMFPTAFLFFGLIAAVMSGVVAIFALRKAPEGFQDVNGFHLVTASAHRNALSQGRHEDSELLA